MVWQMPKTGLTSRLRELVVVFERYTTHVSITAWHKMCCTVQAAIM